MILGSSYPWLGPAVRFRVRFRAWKDDPSARSPGNCCLSGDGERRELTYCLAKHMANSRASFVHYPQTPEGVSRRQPFSEPGMLDLPSARGGPPRRGRRPGPVHQPPRQWLTIVQAGEMESSTYTALA